MALNATKFLWLFTAFLVGCTAQTPGPQIGSPPGSVPLGSPTEASPTTPTIPHSCLDRGPDPAGDLAPADLLDQIDLAKATDARCVCRALAVAAVTDPGLAIAEGVSPERLQRMTDQHAWALSEAAAVATGDLAVAVGGLQGFFQQMTAEGQEVWADDERVAKWLIRRADPMFVEPLATADAACLLAGPP